MRGHGSSAGVQEHGCGAIANLAVSSDARKDSLMGAGAAGAVLAALQSHGDHAEVQWWGKEAIQKLAYGNQSRQRQIRDAGGGAYL